MRRIGPSGPPSDASSVWGGKINRPGAEATADGLLARLTVDTTGLQPGSWPLLLYSDQLGLTELPFAPTEVENGWITVIPEPATLAVFLVGGVALLRSRRRR